MNIDEARIIKRLIREKLYLPGCCKILAVARGEIEQCKCALCQIDRMDETELWSHTLQLERKGFTGLEIQHRISDSVLISKQEKRMNSYFIEYSEDAMIPRKANPELVKKYVDMMKENDLEVDTYPTKEEMNEFAMEFGHQAKDGISAFEEYDDKEMEEMIKNASDWYGTSTEPEPMSEELKKFFETRSIPDDSAIGTLLTENYNGLLLHKYSEKEATDFLINMYNTIADAYGDG